MFMVSIKKKTINGKTYYYLEHSYRKNGRVYKKEKYIGNKLPKNIDKLKEKLLLELYEELWFKQFDKIKNTFNKGLKISRFENFIFSSYITSILFF